MDRWMDVRREVATLPQITVPVLAERLERGQAPIVLDVRSDAEWQSEHIAGAVHLYAGEIPQGANPPIPKDAEISVICGSGYRSSFVASLLQERGYRNLINVDGGMDAWNKRHLPVVSS